MATIFHLALASDWAAAQGVGAYTVSTLGRTLAEEGFIHASRGDQWPTVRDRFYGDVTEPLLLLRIDTDRLDVPVVEEPAAPGSPETFPHIYGPLALDAVMKAIPVPVRGGLPTPATPHATPPAPDGDSFGRIFLSEMLVNMALLVLTMSTTVIGVSVGSAIGGDTALIAGLALGLLVGGGLARWIYVRRHA